MPAAAKRGGEACACTADLRSPFPPSQQPNSNPRGSEIHATYPGVVEACRGAACVLVFLRRNFFGIHTPRKALPHALLKQPRQYQSHGKHIAKHGRTMANPWQLLGSHRRSHGKRIANHGKSMANAWQLLGVHRRSYGKRLASSGKPVAK